MRLVRLTGLERDKIEGEYNALIEQIDDFKDILAHTERVDKIIYDELLDIKSKFGDDEEMICVLAKSLASRRGFD